MLGRSTGVRRAGTFAMASAYRRKARRTAALPSFAGTYLRQRRQPSIEGFVQILGIVGKAGVVAKNIDGQDAGLTEAGRQSG